MLRRFFNYALSRRAPDGNGPSRQRGTPEAPPDERLYAVGDIHGRADLLGHLLTLIDSAPGETAPRLVFLGDYVDRGPASHAVIERLAALKEAPPAGWRPPVFLKGNHEAALMDFLAAPDERPDWLDWGGVETLQSYGVEQVDRRAPHDLAEEFAARLPAAHRAFFDGLSLSYTAGDYFFAHAGVRPNVPLADQQEQDLLWIRGEFHRMAPEARPDKVVVHGHEPQKRPLDAGWRICVDTGAVWSDVLTAVALEGASRRFISAKAKAPGRR